MPLNLRADLDQVRLSAEFFLEPGSVFELRAPKTERDGTFSGYFDDRQSFIQAVREIDGRSRNIYVTLNPLSRDLLSRAVNRVKRRVSEAVRDIDVLRRVRLLIDLDPIRPKEVSSTDAEHEAALLAAIAIRSALSARDWPMPLLGDSGNGGHLLYAIDLPNDEESKGLLSAVLGVIKALYSAPGIEIDQTVYNAARISKVYGTVARKGDSTEDRPHRISRIIESPSAMQVVPLALLQSLAAEAKPESASAPRSASARFTGPQGDFRLEEFISRHAIDIHRGPVPEDGGEKWVLDHCPFNPDHRHPDAAIFRRPGGRLGFKCFHNSCADRDWESFRDFFEPNRPRQRSPRGSQQAGGAAIAERDSCDEIPPTAADVEAAADEAIAQNDMSTAYRLVPALAQIRPLQRVVIVAKLREHFKKRWKDREFEQALRDAVEEMRRAGAPPPTDDDDPPGDDEGPDLLPFPLTDAGNGERVVAMFGTDIRYCMEMKQWLVWDGIRWAIDHFAVMRQKAKAMLRKLYRQARAEGKGAHRVHARDSESYGAVTAALAWASTEPGIRVSASDLDQHPFLLNCPNGVVHLKDRKLMRHSRDFMITKLCPVPFDPGAKCPRFLEFIQWAMGATNPEAEVPRRTAAMVGFLQRAFGYALTGDVSERALFIFYGKTGKNGKTTLLSLFRNLLGSDYSGQIGIETVTAQGKLQDATMRADLADLRGTRFAVTSEVERESRLNERTIKYITAGDAPIKSCRKYENPIEFWATHKLFMDCNYRPVIRGSEDAIWDRLRLVSFEVRVSKEDEDKQLPDKLRAEFPGILAWAVNGCSEWVKAGLQQPPEVAEAVQEWREHDDPLKDFLGDRCVIDLENVKDRDLDKRIYVAVADLTNAYLAWAKEANEKFPLSREGLRERMEAKGFWECRSRRLGTEQKQTRTWEGVMLKDGVTIATEWGGPSRATK